MTHDIEQNTPALSPTRRTVLTGAAWTLPVIAAATITPMAAASNAPVLTFDKSTYNGTACGTISGAYITVTVNSVPTAGTSVTTSLSSGYKFSDGTTTNTQVSGSNGRVNLPAINVPAVGGNGSMVATQSTSSSATASISSPVPQSGAAYGYDWNGNSTVKQTGIPAGSKPVGYNSFLTQDNRLFVANTLVASGVSDAVAQPYADANSWHTFVTYISSSGAYRYDQNGGASTKYTNVPSGSKPVGKSAFLAPNNDLYFNNAVLATNVTSAISQPYYDAPADTWHNHVTYVSSNGSYVYDQNGGTFAKQTSIPAGSTAVGYGSFLTQDNRLFVANTLVATGVSDAVAQPYADFDSWHTFVTYTSSSGAYMYDQNGASSTKFTNVPSGAKPVGRAAFLAPNNNLYFNNAVLASNVTAAVSQPYFDHPANTWHNYITYSTAAPC